MLSKHGLKSGQGPGGDQDHTRNRRSWDQNGTKTVDFWIRIGPKSSLDQNDKIHQKNSLTKVKVLGSNLTENKLKI